MTPTLDGNFPLHACLPQEITDESELPAGRGWIIQPKHDGHRILVDYRGDTPKILNRKGEPYGARRFRIEIPRAAQGLVLDGEFIPACNGYPDRYIIFDCLWSNNTVTDPTRKDDHPLYAQRFGHRMHYVHRCIDPDQLHVTGISIARFIRWNSTDADLGFTIDERAALEGWGFERIDQIDGIVYKDPTAPYVPGRRGPWYKFKFTNDIDVAVTALAIDSKSNCELSVWDSVTKTMFPVGRAATAGKDPISVGSVVTVRFLEFTDGLRLREPRIVQVRDDKSPHDCTVAQLVPHCRKLTTESTTPGVTP